MIDPMRARGGGRRAWLALLLSSAAAMLGAASLLVPGNGATHALDDSYTVADLKGEASIMSGVAYNTPQPHPDPSQPLHFVGLPEGGTNTTPLDYAFPSSSQLLLHAESSRVSCNAQGNSPNATTAHAYCEVVLEGLQVWVGPYKIIKADRVRVASSSIASASSATSYPTIQIEGLCVYIEQEFSPGQPCATPGPGQSVTINRPPISGTVTRGGTEAFPSNGNQLGAGSRATAFKLNLLNDDYSTITGVRSVIIDVGYAESFAGQPWGTPTPTPTPTKTPTPSPTPSTTPSPTTWEAVVPGVSRDE